MQILLDESCQSLSCVLIAVCFCGFVQVLLDESQKFFKLLELLGKSDQQESTLIFVDKQESAGECWRAAGAVHKVSVCPWTPL